MEKKNNAAKAAVSKAAETLANEELKNTVELDDRALDGVAGGVSEDEIKRDDGERGKERVGETSEMPEDGILDELRP